MIGIETGLPPNLAIATALPFYGPIELIRASWTSQGAILPYFLHGLIAAAPLLAFAMTPWNRGSVIRPLAPATKFCAPSVNPCTMMRRVNPHSGAARIRVSPRGPQLVQVR